jgi:hypothetical protein
MFHARVAPAAARFARDSLRPSSTHNFAFRGRRLLSNEPPLSRIPPRGPSKVESNPGSSKCGSSAELGE